MSKQRITAEDYNTYLSDILNDVIPAETPTGTNLGELHTNGADAKRLVERVCVLATDAMNSPAEQQFDKLLKVAVVLADAMTRVALIEDVEKGLFDEPVSTEVDMQTQIQNMQKQLELLEAEMIKQQRLGPSPSPLPPSSELPPLSPLPTFADLSQLMSSWEKFFGTPKPPDKKL